MMAYAVLGYLSYWLTLSVVTARFQKEETLRISDDPHFNHTIVIGAPISFDMNDVHYTSGIKLKNGWTMFTEWVNDRGGILFNGENVSITLICIEDYSDPEYVQLAVDSLLYSDRRADIFLAPYSSSLTNDTAVLTEPAGKILMAGAAANTQVFFGKNYTYATTCPSLLYVRDAFRSLATFKAKRVAVIRDRDDPICLAEAVNAVSASSSVELYGYYDLDPTAVDYEEQIYDILVDLNANQVESVMGCSYLDLCIYIPTIAKSIDYNPEGMIFMICDVMQEVRDTLGSDAEYLIGIIPWVPTVNTVDKYVGWTSQEFHNRYVTTFNSEPTTIGASAFAGIEILVSTIEATQSLDTDVIQQALSTTTYSTLYANISFDSNHQANMVMLAWQLRMNNSEFIMDIIVDPPDKATAPVVWPAPTWQQRDCTTSTLSCSSHGMCDSTGTCICDEHYYGSSPTFPCDTYCEGEIMEDTGLCHSNKVFYIGGLVDYSSIDKDEIIGTMQFAVDLINNHTDGWFDSTRQVTLVLEIADSQCSRQGGEAAARYLNDWAINTSKSGGTLDGLVGATCSDASIGSAKFGNTIHVSQVSYGSTSNVLSDKDEYIYFARTCFADESQGELVVDLLEDIGLVPFIAVIASSDSYAQSLSVSIMENYLTKGYNVLLSYTYTPHVLNASTAAQAADQYNHILDQIAASGSPVTVLVMYVEEVIKLMEAASVHPVFSQDTMVWVGIEMWINVDGPWNKNGMVGLKPYTPSANVTTLYMDMWAALDSDLYPDSDGDRHTLGSNTLYVADAVFALALAFQQSTDLAIGTDDDDIKKHIFTTLTQDVTFTGVSGPVDLNSVGNRDDPIFGIASYGHSSWTSIGYTNEEGIFIKNYSQLVWPDLTTGRATTYSKQQPLYCAAGMEPSITTLTPVIYSCTSCRVGTYSADVSPDPCQICPDGTECNDVGIQIPCISNGYWRAEPLVKEQLGDFQTYPVFACDFVEGCVSGCTLNDTCAEGRVGTSVTCGVCQEGYYLNFRGKCLRCAEDNALSPLSVILIYMGSIFFLGVIFCIGIHLFASSEIQALKVSSPSASSKNPAALSKVAHAMTKVKSNVTAYLSPHNFRDVLITSKIVLAFFQVMSAFFLLDLNNMSSIFQDFVHNFNINPFRGNEDVVACSTLSDTIPSYYFIVLNCFFLPLIITGMFGAISLCVYYYHRMQLLRMTPSQSLTKTQQENCFKLSSLLGTMFTRIILWLCLVFYPSLCSIVLSVFNCRDFGVSGIWLRVDNEISCESATYTAYVCLASVGVLLYVVGIPLLFFYAIKNRHLSLWHVSSRFLHQGFVDEWIYFEIVDLIRKLLITSVSQFVASPSSSSQVLFMLIINCFALYLLTTATPYRHPNDNNLSTVLTAIECISFLFALLIVSGISDTEGFSEASIFNALIAMLVVGLFVFTPYTFMTKIDYFKKKINATKKKIEFFGANHLPRGSTLPDLSRLSGSGRARSNLGLFGIDWVEESDYSNQECERGLAMSRRSSKRSSTQPDMLEMRDEDVSKVKRTSCSSVTSECIMSPLQLQEDVKSQSDIA